MAAQKFFSGKIW